MNKMRNYTMKIKNVDADCEVVMDKYINQIINADCLDILKDLPDKCIDLLCTDPPVCYEFSK